MDLYVLPQVRIIIFALILLRMIGFILSSAIFSSGNINGFLKVLFSVLLAVLIYPTLDIPALELRYRQHDYDSALILLSIREVLIGLTFGFLTRCFLFCLSMAGDFISISMGLGSAQLYNPAMAQSGNVIEHFYTYIGILIFLAIGGHHSVIIALSRTFTTISVADLSFNFLIWKEVVLTVHDMLIVVIKIASPFLVTILISNIALGILGRFIPQINVQVTTMPVIILLGFGLIFISLPLLVMEMSGLLDSTMFTLRRVIEGF